MKDTIFREYDIRGRVGDELRIDQVYDLVCAMASYFISKKPDIKKIAVGMDGRVHSPAIKEAACNALLDSGLDVLFVGTCPSPVVNFALHTLSVDGGLMITASHNPKEYNGFKMSLGKEPVWGKDIGAIRDLYGEKKKAPVTIRGSLSEYELIPDYIAWLADHFAHLQGMQMSILVDCGNGAAGTVLPELVSRMHWRNVQLLYPDVDGTYPHHEADPTVEANMRDMKKMLIAGSYDCGLGLDGDCDRMAPMTASGQLILGDTLLALFAQPIVKAHPGATVVFDIKSSAGLIELLSAWGATPCISATGHTNIKEQMKQQDALLGGELSCHFFFKDRYFGYDDGIYAMMRLIELLCDTGKSLEELVAIFPHKYSSREYRIACPDDLKRIIVDRVTDIVSARSDVAVITLDGVRAMWSDGWGILRASNTQPALSMRFEAESPSALNRIKKEFIDLLADDMDGQMLRTQLEIS
jgi:phosphomannomutase / phosphoglucomutase